MKRRAQDRQLEDTDAENGNKRARTEFTESGDRHDFTSYLPEELSVRIFSFLDFRSLPAALSVSKSFQRLCNDNQVWYAPPLERLTETHRKDLI